MNNPIQPPDDQERIFAEERTMSATPFTDRLVQELRDNPAGTTTAVGGYTTGGIASYMPQSSRRTIMDRLTSRRNKLISELGGIDEAITKLSADPSLEQFYDTVYSVVKKSPPRPDVNESPF